jgi:putative sigma-54 modulation protein
MKLQITTRRFDATPEFRTFTEDRIRKLTRYFDHIIDVNVILSVEKHRQAAEVTVHTNGSDLVGTSESADMRISLDQAVSRIEAQLKKHKEKRTGRRRTRTSLGEALAAEVDSKAVDSDEDAEE